MYANLTAMKRFLSLLSFLALLLPPGRTLPNTPQDTTAASQAVGFSENKGQFPSQVAFRAQMREAAFFIENDAFTIVVQHPDNPHLQHPHTAVPPSTRHREHAYRMTFVGCQPTEPVGSRPLEGYENYFLGNDPSRWASHVLQFAHLQYSELYPGIDLVLYSGDEGLKYDFVVQPEADPSQIAIRYDGVDGLRLQGGDLHVQTSVGDMVESRPYAYQERDGKRQTVEARYKITGNKVHFQLGSYDKSLPLVIDPQLIFSTYTGSHADNWGSAATFDSYKNVYSSGLVFATNYPVSLGGYDNTYHGNADIGIIKFNPTGSTRLYATYLGGSMAEMPHSMFVNSFDELLIFGTTGSSDFPTSDDAYDQTFNGGPSINYESTIIPFPYGVDLFVCRFSADGATLQASTFIGGSGNDGLNYHQRFNANYEITMLGNDSLYYNYGDGARGELITDDQNNVYVGTTTFSSNFPTTPGCVQPNYGGGQEGVVFKLDYNLSHLMWSTYLGGYKDDAVYSIDVDESYNLLVCGGTNSPNFPTTANAYATGYHGGSTDGFVTKISYYGDRMMASSFFGSPAYDQCYFVRVGRHNEVFLFGQTKASGSTLIHNATYGTPNSGQFLARLAPNLDTLRWSTVFGTGNGKPNISPTAFAVDVCNRVYVSGWGRDYVQETFGIDWYTQGTTNMDVTADAYSSTTDGMDFYVMSIDENASTLNYGTFIGEPHSSSRLNSGHDHVDGGTSRFDKLGNLYQAVCASCGRCNAFPTTEGAYSRNNESGNCNNAVFRLSIDDSYPVAEFVQPVAHCAPYTVQFHNTGRGEDFQWDFGDGTTASEAEPTHVYTEPGLYTVKLVATLPGGCTMTDTTSRQVLVLGNRSYSLDSLTTCGSRRVQIGLNPMLGCTYRWTGGVSDSTIANPYVDHSGLYTLVVSAEGCGDTVRQQVGLGLADVQMLGDGDGCVSPFVLRAEVNEGASLIWTSRRDGGDTLGRSDELSLTLQRDTDMWVYVNVVDNIGCTARDSARVTFSAILRDLQIEEPRCVADCDGRAAVVLSGHVTAPASYTWTGYPGPSADSNRTDLCSGTHAVTVSDAAGCVMSRVFSVPEPVPPRISHWAHHLTCHGRCDGAVGISVSGRGPHRIQWTDDGSSDSVRTGLCPGIYHVTIWDSAGCEYTDTVEVRDESDLTAHIDEWYNSCAYGCTGSAVASAAGGQPPYTYDWSEGSHTPAVADLCPGWIRLDLTDASGCAVKDSVFIDRQLSFENMQLWADDDTVFDGIPTGLHVTSLPQAQYVWRPAELLRNAHQPDTWATLVEPATFTVTVTDSVGCQWTDSIHLHCITVDCGETNISIPNAFTPNGDGINDRLCVSGEWIAEFHLVIYSRWGELVYESNDIDACWDGTFRGNMCQSGVYTYFCRVVCEANKTSTFKGDITLLR